MKSLQKLNESGLNDEIKCLYKEKHLIELESDVAINCHDIYFA